MSMGGRGILFLSKRGSRGEREQGYVPERLQEVRSLAGVVLPHQAASCDRTLARSLNSHQGLTSPHGKLLMGP